MTLVALSDDLTRLVAEGYDVEIRDGNLLVHHVPYVTSAGEVAFCILISELTTNGERTLVPGRHEVWVVGDIPHDHQGNRLIIVIEELTNFGEGLTASSRLSGKPHGRHPVDYHEKIANYVRLLGSPARFLEPTVTHTAFPAHESSADESVFRYHDAASSRSALTAVTARLKTGKVAIVGLGGTGSYVLDLLAKTPVEEIHLFDDDEFVAHNAFRAPGAASLDEVRVCPKKVDYFAGVYERFRRCIIPHPVRVDAENVHQLQDMSFVFLAMDAGPGKRIAVDFLRGANIAFVDCGMGLTRVDDSLRGAVRTTLAGPGRYTHVDRRVSYQDIAEDEYNLNMQTADLNMLNAAMAVIRWKKFVGYYDDTKAEYNSVYVVATNQLISGEVEP